MKKKDLIRRAAKNAGEIQSRTEKILDAAFEEIVKMLQEGEQIHLHGFGKFETKVKKEHTKKMPDGTIVVVPEQTQPVFKFFESVRCTF